MRKYTLLLQLVVTCPPRKRINTAFMIRLSPVCQFRFSKEIRPQVFICNYQICKKGRLDDVWVGITIVVEPADEPGVGIVVVLPGAFDDAGIHYPPHGWIDGVIVIHLWQWQRLD